MSIKSPLLAVPIKYGLVGGILSVLIFSIIYVLGKNPLIIYRDFDFSFLLLPIFIAFSIKEFRDNWNNRSLKFGEGMTVGFINYLIVATISGVFIFIFLNIESFMLAEYISDRSLLIMNIKDDMIKTMGQEVYQQTYNDLQDTTAYVIALDDFLKKIFIGLFLTIIISIIFKK